MSLTTYGKRFYDVAIAIESIMQGTVKPNRIILWLGEDMKSLPIPVTLQRQMERGLETEYCKDIRSFTKLIPCLKKYPEACIITIDDDIIYPYDLVEKFVNTHKLYPEDILCTHPCRIVLDKKGMPLNFYHWHHNVGFLEDNSVLNFFEGVGGAFYPPHCFDDEVFNEEVFLDICKFADDVWFNAMALKKGTRNRKCYTHVAKGRDFIVSPLPSEGLSTVNFDFKGEINNDTQLAAVFEKYDLYKKLK